MATKQRKFIDRALTLTGTVVALVLLLIGCLAWKAHTFVASNVHNELASQKITFPPAGSPAIAALPADDQAAVSKYAGQQLVNGDQAKVYANNFIAVHLQEVAGGQTYAQVSTAAQANPTNPKLQAEANTLFKGETLRGLLLGDAYAFWTVGRIAEIAAIVAFAGAAAMFLLVIGGLRQIAKS